MLRARLVLAGALLFLAALFAGCGDPIVCTRDASGGRCTAAGKSFALADVMGLQIEVLSHDSTDDTDESRLVLITRGGKVPISASYYVIFDPRPATAARFNDFLASGGAVFPASADRWKSRLEVLALALLAIVTVLWALLGRSRVRVDVDEGQSSLVVTRRPRSRPPSVVRLPLYPLPSVQVHPESTGPLGPLHLWLVQNDVSTPILEPTDFTSAQRDALVARLEAVLRPEGGDEA